MKPEKILESNLLDIVFENRNKDYGAYELRKNYNNRAIKALGITALVVVAFGLMQSFKVPEKTDRELLEGPVVMLTDIPKQKVEEKIKEEQPKEKEIVKEKAIDQPKAFQEIKSTTIDIVKDNLVITPIPNNNEMDNKVIGKNNKLGELGLPGENNQPQSKGKEIVGETFVEPSIPAGPIVKAEIMPQFPGGQAAFIKFMQKHLRQPDDFEEGQKMTVIARFVVDAEGNIVDIDITQNGRNDLDAEVVRVIKKMPTWVPGMQNGRKVAVYFKVPVTFVAGE